jgi:phosphatidylserine decarboxylase
MSSGAAVKATPWRERLSRCAGRLARAPASRFLIPWFSWRYGVERSEALEPARGFASLQQFFCRPLKPGLRPVAAAPEVLVSPADAVVGTAGVIEQAQLFEAKNRRYRLAELIADEAVAAALDGGAYCTLYLAPGHYHRVHAPETGWVREAIYIPGAFYPVHPRAVARLPGLLCANQRLVTWLDTRWGRIGVVMVGACLVGGIRVNYDTAWNAGPGPHAAARREYDPPVRFARGEELGHFEFGSTVILLVPPSAAWRPALKPGYSVRVGEPLMRVADAAATPPPAVY